MVCSEEGYWFCLACRRPTHLQDTLRGFLGCEVCGSGQIQWHNPVFGPVEEQQQQQKGENEKSDGNKI